jgi:predicted peroxiredoxin
MYLFNNPDLEVLMLIVSSTYIATAFFLMTKVKTARKRKSEKFLKLLLNSLKNKTIDSLGEALNIYSCIFKVKDTVDEFHKDRLLHLIKEALTVELTFIS